VNPLPAEFVKRLCAFVLRIEMPLQTLERIIQLLTLRKIHVEIMQMNSVTGGEAILILHCQVEKDRIRHTQCLLEKLEGIATVELLESKITNVVKLNTNNY
jgi:acetolactate synthase regulatory subunit